VSGNIGVKLFDLLVMKPEINAHKLSFVFVSPNMPYDDPEAIPKQMRIAWVMDISFSHRGINAHLFGRY
jgi:hypothetical protein